MSLTLCDPMDSSLPGSSVHGILQVKILEWVAISSSRASSQPRDWTEVSHIADRFFIIWASRGAQCSSHFPLTQILEKVKVKSLSCVWLLVTPWTEEQAPLSMVFSRQEYWSGLPCPSPGVFWTQGSNLGLSHCKKTLPYEPPGKALET